jgi:hypothetical protein
VTGRLRPGGSTRAEGIRQRRVVYFVGTGDSDATRSEHGALPFSKDTRMSQRAEFRCRCGEIQGRVEGASPRTLNRVVCYCDGCQAFLHHLGRADLLDAHGGSDIVQAAPASVHFDRGADRIVGVRLAPKGLYRWYGGCCKTPVGNTAGPSLPFVGILTGAFQGAPSRADDTFGKPIGAICGKYAIGKAPKDSTGSNARLLARTIVMVLGWRLRGKSWPHPFFDRATRAPSHPVITLSPAERESLRPLCGPHPAARPA